MSLKNEIEKTMFAEGIEDRIQDIATFMDIPVENVKKRLKTLTFSDYIEVMTALKTKNKDKIERIMGMPARDPNWKSPIDDVDEGAEMHISPDIARAKTLQHTLPSLDREKYEPRDGLEGPIMTKAGKVVYYDPIEGSYYDPDTDIYLSYEEWKDLSEAYSTGSQGPEEEQPLSATDQMVQGNKEQHRLRTARTQAMQRLGRDNLGGATAQQTATAIDKAEQGIALTPIQRQSIAYQAANLDNLAMNPDTRIQFRNLLNKLRKAQADQEGQ